MTKRLSRVHPDLTLTQVLALLGLRHYGRERVSGLKLYERAVFRDDILLVRGRAARVWQWLREEGLIS